MKVYVAVKYDMNDAPEVKTFTTLEKAQTQLYAWGGEYLFDFFKREGRTEDIEALNLIKNDYKNSWIEYGHKGIISVCWGDDDNRIDCWIEETEIN